jgi:hypothetical protein
MGAISLKYKSKSGNLTAPGDVDPGAMIPIATTTLGTAAANITFSNIPQEYEHLQVRGVSFVTSTDQILYFQFNNDTGNNYAAHLLTGNGVGSASHIYQTSFDKIKTFGQTYGIGTVAPTATITEILDYSNASKNTTLRTLGGVERNGTGEVQFTSGLWVNTAAVTSIKLFSLVNFAANTSFALYGIKKAGA